ncbi:hypothetical protein HY439_01100 [Candidatus Microgenomates bacterium]|nr:hypothetical protein [Candidatus Microgenomates bacterium]
MGKTECLRLNHTGNCGGCNIVEIAERIDGPRPTENTLTKLAGKYCPEGERPILPPKEKPSIW